MERKLKRRFADARANEDIIEKVYKNICINDEEFSGNVSLLEINKVKRKWIVDEEKRCVLDDKYAWLEIYPNNKNYCITVMFDDKRNVTEWYIDIAKKLGTENGIPYEDDLFLDVVLVPDGRILLLDEDELEEALNTNRINKEEYDLAYNIANKLILNLPNHIEKLNIFSNKYLNILENKK